MPVHPPLQGIVAFVLFVVALAPEVAAAQERRGFWISATGGGASAGIGCDGCDADRESGALALLSAGVAKSQRLLLGAEFGVWYKEGVDTDLGAILTVNYYTVTGTATFYPWASSGFFVKGGLGMAMVDNELRVEGSSITFDMGKGFGSTGAVGYDVLVGGNFSITLAGNFSYGYLGDLRVLNEVINRRFSFNTAGFSLGFTWH